MTPYEVLGGRAGCLQLSTAFYARVARDPVLRPLFPGKSMRCAIEEFSAFLAQLLNGPTEDSQFRWWLSLRESHSRFKIGPREREAWMANMIQAVEDVQIEDAIKTELLGFFRHSSAYVVNQPGPAVIDQDLPATRFSKRWQAQVGLDEAVAAIRAGDSDRAIAFAESADGQLCGRSVLAGVLSLMVRCGHHELLAYVADKITQDSSLIHERYNGRTLLHEAAAGGRLDTMELLLRLGADPNVKDGGEHTPLYSVANECAVEGGGVVVHALMKAGADVNRCDGAKHCTPLHMAARRGSVEIAEALLDCGADLEARDSVGDTPLRRAVNCAKPDLASLLVDRGADVDSIGSKGLTPILAARSKAMKQILSSRG